MAKDKKNNLIVKYDSAVDALSLVLKGGQEAAFEEMAPGVSVEFNDKNEVIGFEILNASRHFKKIFASSNKKTRTPIFSR